MQGVVERNIAAKKNWSLKQKSESLSLDHHSLLTSHKLSFLCNKSKIASVLLFSLLYNVFIIFTIIYFMQISSHELNVNKRKKLY